MHFYKLMKETWRENSVYWYLLKITFVDDVGRQILYLYRKHCFCQYTQNDFNPFSAGEQLRGFWQTLRAFGCAKAPSDLPLHNCKLIVPPSPPPVPGRRQSCPKLCIPNRGFCCSLPCGALPPCGKMLVLQTFHHRKWISPSKATDKPSLQFTVGTRVTLDLEKDIILQNLFWPNFIFFLKLIFIGVWLLCCCCCFCSVAKSCPTLCDLMNCSTLGFPVFHYLPEFAQTHVHWVINAIQPSHPLLHLLLLLSIFPRIRVFSNESALCIRWPKYWSFSISISPSSEYSDLVSFRTDWFISLLFKGLSRVFSSTTIQKHPFFEAQPSLWSSSHIRTWLLEKNSFDYTELCRQMLVSAV